MDRVLDAWDTTPPASKARRVLYSLLLGLGWTLTFAGSMFWGAIGPISLKYVPDVRIFGPMVLGLVLGLVGSMGGQSSRRPALFLSLCFIVGFHLEEATMQWIGPYPGSITGTRVGLLGTAGSLLALASVLLIHVETEATRLARDLVARGADVAGASEAADALLSRGTRRILGLAAGIAGMGLVVRAAEAVLGNEASGGAWVLLVGAAMLFALAIFLLRLVKPSAPRAQPLPDDEPEASA